MSIDVEEVVAMAGLAGEILIKNGAETYRVEETIEHIVRACGCTTVESFVIPTGLFLTATDANGHTLTSMRRIRERTVNLDRIDKVNELSRRMVDGRIQFHDAYAILRRIARERTGFSLFPSIAASGVVGGATGILLNGNSVEIAIAFFAAGVVRYIAHVVSRWHAVQFTYQFLGAAAVAVIGLAVEGSNLLVGRDIIIIGGIMPMVPGMAITNAIRDIISGDLLSGMSRGIEAALTSVAVAMGVAIVLAVRG